MDSAHVFVTLGDLTHIECDAWMLPSDQSYSVRGHWLGAVPELTEDVIRNSTVEAFNSGVSKATPVVGWSELLPLPVLTAVPALGLETADDLEELGRAVEEFVRVAATSAGPRHGRAKKLVAMPAFGTEGGGGAFKKGEILNLLLDRAQAAAQANEVDVVLVLRDKRTFALAQQVRKAKSGLWSELDADQFKKAQDLARLASSGKLVPFMGAGVSAGSGAPTWKELIDRLAARISIGEADLKALKAEGRSALDQAAFLREEYVKKTGDPASFGQAVAETVKSTRYGLVPALLASLQTEEAITLNYDILFELASADVGTSRFVIPGDGSEDAGGDAWLLKLHGSVRDPASIVLTRDDYLGYNTNREALSAIVKANLITRHLLFVGFGLTDDHFHQIVHDVRKAIPRAGGKKFGTSLRLSFDPFDEALWADQLDLVTLGAEDDLPGSARRLEIFLDALLAFATDSHSYLLDPAFESSLEPAERELRQKLLDFRDSLGDSYRDLSSWPVIDRMFEELGGA
ncbi:MAG: SIR2 family protein [Microbacteriaceae bacterium]|nr:SIR2 family protein [Microbacteriaceae bacterium]